MTPVRFVVLALLAACQTVAPTALGNGDTHGSGSGSGSGGGGAAPECAVAADCALASTKCCDCPTFAVPLADPAHTACDTVSCGPTSTCPNNVTASCETGTCALVCAPLACAVSCPDGYVIDPTGCLECACTQTNGAPACTRDSDCVRTRADCCGCANGGTDTAVPASEQGPFDASLGCPTAPACPGGDTCAAGTEPRCIEGSCELAMPMPANACTGSCPTGQQCVINADATATMQGLGVCM
jgi:hypothetical protein